MTCTSLQEKKSLHQIIVTHQKQLFYMLEEASTIAGGQGATRSLKTRSFSLKNLKFFIERERD